MSALAAARRLLDRIRRPEYTGENRCWPCTAINAAIVAGAAALAARRDRKAALAALVGGGAAIALRGYVVPYTPRFAPRIVARLPFDSGRERRRSDALVDGELDPERLVAELFDRGVLAGDEELYLADGFRTDWEAEAATLRGLDADALATAAADASPSEATGEADGEWTVVTDADGRTVWLSRPVAIAETAAVRALTARGVPRDTAAHAATPLRMFAETCPLCGGDVVETTVTDCCGGTMGVYDAPGTDVLACDACDAIVYEFPAAVEADA
ncbi:hypothetical protein [Halegenticoccus soli]|uniref:hypothetical protein n=1 Tax=Halegenticoccus soli TaxID=1985678 RepID=UPI000C6E59A4|nr:hypothetical protein [Halegenticoccus soli]